MTYASEVLADSPVVYWKLDDTSGTSAADASGNSRAGTYTGGFTLSRPPLTPGSTQAMGVNGSAPCGVQIAQAAWMETATFTHELIFKANTVSPNQVLVCRDDLGGSPTNRHSLLYLHGAELAGAVHTNTNEADFTTGGAIVAGQTYHVAITYDGTRVRAYLNGSLCVNSIVTSGALNTTSAMPITVGWSPGFGGLWGFNGDIDEFASYGTALSGARIAAHYAASLAPGPNYTAQVLLDTPWGYWPCNEDSGLAIGDRSGNSRHMTIAGSPLAYSVPGPKGLTAISWPNSTSINAETSAVPATTTDFTLEAWVRMTALPSAQVTVLSPAVFASSDASSESAIGVDAAGKPFLRWWNGGDNQITGASALALNTWHHIVGVGKSGSGVKLRVNKVDVVGFTSSVAAAQAHNLWIHAGKTSTGTQGNITIANAAYYRAALSDARIDAHYDATDDPPPAPAMQQVSRVHAEMLTGLVPPVERISRVHAEVLTTLVPPVERISRVHAEVLGNLIVPETRVARVHTEVLWQPSQPGEWVQR